MTVYIGTVNGNLQPTGYTSLDKLCGILEVPYISAKLGKRIWTKVLPGELKATIIHIQEVEVEKIKGRGRKKAA